MAKLDGKFVRANMAMTRQAMTNAKNRAIPRFKHPAKGKGAKAVEPVAEQPAEASAEEAVATPESDAS